MRQKWKGGASIALCSCLASFEMSNVKRLQSRKHLKPTNQQQALCGRLVVPNLGIGTPSRGLNMDLRGL